MRNLNVDLRFYVKEIAGCPVSFCISSNESKLATKQCFHVMLNSWHNDLFLAANQHSHLLVYNFFPEGILLFQSKVWVLKHVHCSDFINPLSLWHSMVFTVGSDIYVALAFPEHFTRTLSFETGWTELSQTPIKINFWWIKPTYLFATQRHQGLDINYLKLTNSTWRGQIFSHNVN